MNIYIHIPVHYVTTSQSASKGSFLSKRSSGTKDMPKTPSP